MPDKDPIKAINKHKYKKVAEILRNWDPIGVYKTEPKAPEGEYDLCIAPVIRSLEANPTEEEMAEKLIIIAKEYLGIEPDPNSNVRTAKELITFWKGFKK
ncbi:MAG: hypothetical protein KAJ07_02915 [Planctomycetes bacterium]|nr:hypothetical protein [Planctomycetota bacterium]